MAIYKYPQEVHDLVMEYAPKLRDKELAELVNERLGTSFTDKTMKCFRYNHSVRNGMKQWNKDEYWKYQKRWPQGMYEFIRDNSWGVPSKDMAEMVNEKFGTSFSQSGMKQFRQRHGIKSGETGWFQKGRSPANKGKRIEEYIDDPERVADINRRMAKTQFKKGHKPWDTLPVGSIRPNRDGYLLRKRQEEGTQRERWEFLHRAIWEEAYGPIPEGKVICFRDGDRSNVKLENLIMLTQGEQIHLKKMGISLTDPDEIIEAGRAILRLKNAKNKKKGGRPDGTSEAKAKA